MDTKELPEKVTELATTIGENNMAAVKEVLSSSGKYCLQVVTKERPVGKVICDHVHGHIELHPVCIAIIDTPQFQRLRYLKQMGTCDFVYPGAVHTRFAHSLGVCHLAGLLAKSLKEKQPELGITDKDVLCVQIAGLCHDMGHGPFSHIFDSLFIKSIESNSEWKHEDRSVNMFERMCENKKVEDAFREYELNEEDRNFIKNQIQGLETPSSPLQDGREKKKFLYDRQLQDGREKKKFLYDIVANKTSGIDVDKWDYISRDSFHLGMKSNFDHLRFIHFARVVDVDNKPQICLRDNEAYEVHQMYETRFIIHKKACHHRVTSATSLMIVDALKEANDKILIPKGDGTRVKMSECIKKENIDAFTNLTEDIIHRIILEPENDDQNLKDDDQNLKKAKKLLHDLWSRDIYMFVAESSPFPGRRDSDEQKIKEGILLKAELPSVKDLEDRIIVEIVNFDYGMKEENPWDHIHFYSKDNPKKANLLPPEKISYRVPKNLQEYIIRIFLKPTEAPSNDSAKESAKDDKEKRKEDKENLRRVFEIWCKEQK